MVITKVDQHVFFSSKISFPNLHIPSRSFIRISNQMSIHQNKLVEIVKSESVWRKISFPKEETITYLRVPIKFKSQNAIGLVRGECWNFTMDGIKYVHWRVSLPFQRIHPNEGFVGNFVKGSGSRLFVRAAHYADSHVLVSLWSQWPGPVQESQIPERVRHYDINLDWKVIINWSCARYCWTEMDVNGNEMMVLYCNRIRIL